MMNSFIKLTLISLLLTTGPFVHAKSCKVGLMTCENYCSGALVVKLYQLLEQGLIPLFDINLDYQKSKQTCTVEIFKKRHRFNQQQLLTIARAKSRYYIEKKGIFFFRTANIKWH